MYNPNGAMIRALVAKLPPQAFDEIVWEFPECLEQDEWRAEYYHWESYDNEEERLEIYDAWELDPDDPELFVMEFNDGMLIIE